MKKTFSLRIASFNFIVVSWHDAQYKKILQKGMLYQTFLIEKSSDYSIWEWYDAGLKLPSLLTHHSELCRHDRKELQEPSTSREDDPDKII